MHNFYNLNNLKYELHESMLVVVLHKVNRISPESVLDVHA